MGRHPKSDVLHRCLAKAIDFLIVAILYQLPFSGSRYGAVFYLLISDGFREGQSVGKRLLGLRMVCEGGPTRLFRASILRNLSFAIGLVLMAVPIVGRFFMLLIICTEGCIVLGNPKGIRIGDRLAQSQVMDCIVRGSEQV